MKTVCNRLGLIFRRELRIFAHRPLFLFTLIVAPVLCLVFFTTLMSDGLPTKLPAGLVDEDDTGAFIEQMRLSLCLCSLWGILSFSLAGFTYPVLAMSGFLQGLSWLFPLRHYYLIYVNQALDGYSILYAWRSVAALLAFLLLPCTVLWRYRAAFLKYQYKQ